MHSERDGGAFARGVLATVLVGAGVVERTGTHDRNLVANDFNIWSSEVF